MAIAVKRGMNNMSAKKMMRGCGESLRVKNSDECPDLEKHDYEVGIESKPHHTPTPWKVIESLKGIGTIYGQCTQECLGTGKTHDHLEMVGEISIANAAGIVRAMNCHADLINALKNLLVADGNKETFNKAWEYDRAVLAKAEGIK